MPFAIPPSIQYALLALVLIGIGDAINKKARLEGIPISSYLLVQAPCFGLTILVITLIRGGIRIAPSEFMLAVIGTALSFAAFTLMLHSLSRGKASINYAIFRLSFVFSSITAIVLLNEACRATKVIGVACAFAAIVLFSLNPGAQSNAYKPVITAVAAMFLNSGYQVVLKIATRTMMLLPAFLLAMSLMFLAAVIAYYLWSGHPPVPKKTFLYAPANGLIMSLGTLTTLFSLSQGDLSTVTPLIQLSFIVTAAASVLFLKERLTFLNWIGITIAVIAIAVLGFA
jgi:drug/metabolite transporter (DMT)-like permease